MNAIIYGMYGVALLMALAGLAIALWAFYRAVADGHFR